MKSGDQEIGWRQGHCNSWRLDAMAEMLVDTTYITYI